MIIQRQEAEQDLNEQIQKVAVERQELLEQLTVLQHRVMNLEAEKQDVQKSASRLEKDKSVLMKTLDKVVGTSRKKLSFIV